MTRSWIAIAVLVIAGTVAFLFLREPPAEPPTQSDHEAHAPAFTQPVDVARVDGLRIVRYEGSGTTLRQEEIVLTKRGQEWWMEKPVVYRAHQKLVQLAVDELGKMELGEVIAEDAGSKSRAGEGSRIAVTASAGGDTLLEMTTGVTPGNDTFVMLAGDDTLYRVARTLRRRFSKSATQLRDSTVLKLDPHSVTRVKYVNSNGTFEMRRRADGDEGEFEPTGAPIKNFDTKRASARANALCNILTKDFVDEALGSDVTGLDDDAASVEIEATRDGAPISVTIRVGKEKTRMRQTYLRTSLSDQIYLVSTHVASRMLISGDEFARTDEQVAREEEARRQAELNPRMQHRHDRGPDQHAEDGHGH